MLQLHLWLLFFQLFSVHHRRFLWLNELTATTQYNHLFYLHSKWSVFHSKRLHFASHRGQLQWKSNNNVVTMKINELQEIKSSHGALTRGIFLDSFFNQFHLWTMLDSIFFRLHRLPPIKSIVNKFIQQFSMNHVFIWCSTRDNNIFFGH